MLREDLFDGGLPPVTLDGDLGADMVVVTTTGLTLPPREAFANIEVLRQQPLEALIGRAVLYLIAAIARQAAFTDPGRFTAVAMDECYWLTSSAEGSAQPLPRTARLRRHTDPAGHAHSRRPGSWR